MNEKNPITIRSVVLGVFQTNCFTVQSGDHLWIVDAGFDTDPLLELVRETGLKPEAILLTHAHPDHVAGIPAVLEAFPGTPVYVHDLEKDWLTSSELNLSSRMGIPLTVPPADRTLTDADVLKLGDTTWRVINTPGHSPGSVCYFCEQTHDLLAGDTLFSGSIGRTDFPNTSQDVLTESIRTKLYSLPDDTIVYPGHGPTTTIGQEKAHNPFVRAEA